MSDFVSKIDFDYLELFPKSRDATLKAWDAADCYLLNESAKYLRNNAQILVVNDQFGALSSSLSQLHHVTHWNDSLLSQMAADKNHSNYQASLLKINNNDDSSTLTLNPLRFTPSTEMPQKPFALIIIRPPKNLNLLDHQLAVLAQEKNLVNTPILCGVMQKFITSTLRDTLARYFDELQPLHGIKKSRVISGKLKEVSAPIKPFHFYESGSLTIANQANVFSGKSIDIGSRFLIEHFPDLSSFKQMADLGCGNGLLSAEASIRYPHLTITGFDESFMAIASAKETFRINGLNNGRFIASHCLDGYQDKFDVIICNPPFHQQRRVTTDTARKMIIQSFHHLEKKGELWIIANRHLGYHQIMKKQFKNCTVKASNHKFVLLCSQRQ